jgi:PRTRC genetic system protein B
MPALNPLGGIISPGTLLDLASRFYWDGEQNETQAIKQRVKENREYGEETDPNSIEMIRRKEVDRAFPKWVLQPHKYNKEPKWLLRAPWGQEVKDLAQLLLTKDQSLSPDEESIPPIYLFWNNPLMLKMVDDLNECLSQTYELDTAIFGFNRQDPSSFTAAWDNLNHQVRIITKLEDLLGKVMQLKPEGVQPFGIEASRESSEELTADKAIMFYGGSSPLVTIHPVAKGIRGLHLLPGKPVSKGDLYGLLKQLNGGTDSAPSGLLPERILRFSPNELLWYRPSGPTPIFFQTPDADLNQLSGKSASHPALLFRARRNTLQVFALADDRRPEMETELFQAPYFNVNGKGVICLGTLDPPNKFTPEAIPGWERIFFASKFTHISGGATLLTRHPGGHKGLWQARTDDKPGPFPAEWLASSHTTLRSVLDDSQA